MSFQPPSWNPGYMKTKTYYVYVLASSRNGTLYIGITNNLQNRLWKHRNKHYEKSFTTKYTVLRLVYYEPTEDIESAIAREKQLKAWKRNWKIDLIEKQNPQWKDLFDWLNPGS